MARRSIATAESNHPPTLLKQQKRGASFRRQSLHRFLNRHLTQVRWRAPSDQLLQVADHGFGGLIGEARQRQVGLGHQQE